MWARHALNHTAVRATRCRHIDPESKNLFYRGVPHLRGFHYRGSLYRGFWILYTQVGDFTFSGSVFLIILKQMWARHALNHAAVRATRRRHIDPESKNLFYRYCTGGLDCKNFKNQPFIKQKK